MNLIKMTNGKYLNKDNGMILDEKEIIGIDISSNDCQSETTKLLSKKKKKKEVVEEVEDGDNTIEETTATD